MARIVLRIRPLEIMEDLQIDTIRERVSQLADLGAELQDTRLSDAPYVTVVADPPTIGDDTLARLQAAFAGLPRMRAWLWQGVGAETLLDEADLEVLERAAGGRDERK